MPLFKRTLGVATATSINKVILTPPTTSATLTLADGCTFGVTGSYTTTLTATNNTSVTLPVSGTLLTTTGDGSNLTGLTKTQVGLSSVENTALSTWAGTSSVTTTGSLTIAGSSPQLTTNNGTANCIKLGNTGSGAPTVSSRSAGTKLVLFSNISASDSESALGIDSGVLWNSVPTSSDSFKWYGGVTLAASLSGEGAFKAYSGITSSTTSDSPTYSAELNDSSNWTKGSGWTGSGASSYTHSSGTAALTKPALTAYQGTLHVIQVAFTSSAGYITMSFGGVSKLITSSTTWSLVPTTSDSISIIPTTDFNGTFTLISVKRVLAASPANFTLQDSGGSSSAQIRTGNDTLYSTFLGGNSGRYNIDGENTGVGYDALSLICTGGDNTAVGYSAIASLSDGDYNIAVGSHAMQFSTVGSYNVALGASALGSHVEGDSSVAIGYAALYGMTAGGGNVAIGQAALVNLTGSNNVSVGHASGTSLTTGTQNTFLGFYSGYDASQKVDATNSTALGYASYTTKDNQVVYGNSSITEHYYPGGTIQMASTTGQKLNLYGTSYAIGVESGELRIASNSKTTFYTGGYTGTNKVAINSSGNLTIGTIVGTTYPLHVATVGSDYLATLTGDELFDTYTTWTLGSGWTGNNTDGFVHSSGTATLVNTDFTTVDSNTVFSLYITVTGRTAGTFTVSACGVSFAGNFSASCGFGIYNPTTSGDFTITPSTGFDGTLKFSLKSVTAGAMLAMIGTNGIHQSYSSTAVNLGTNAGSYQSRGHSSTVIVGYDACRYNASSVSSVVVGPYAGRYAGWLNQSVSIGHLATETSDSISNAVHIGYLAGRYSEGVGNIGVGYIANHYGTGNYNTVLGCSAFSAAGFTGTYNVGIGYSAGAGTTFTGNHNILIGTNTGTASSFSGDQCIAIGYDVELPSTSDDNQTVIGKQIYAWGTGTGARVRIGSSSDDTSNMLQVPGSVKADKYLGIEGSVTWDAGSISSGSYSTTTVTATGAALGDYVLVSASAALNAGTYLTGEVTSASTVTIGLWNLSGSSVDPSSKTYYVRVLAK